MDNTPHIRYSLPDRSYSGGIKKDIHRLAESIGFSGRRLGETDIVVAEIISNIIKHSQEGEILVKIVYDMHGRQGLEILSIDRGPGIENLAEMLKDGISTTHTLGQGFGAIKRLSDIFDIYSLPGWGTILLSRIFMTFKSSEQKKETVVINTLMLPKTGEKVCGDGWKVVGENKEFKLIALDGLGHGPEAHKATTAAIDEFITLTNVTPAETIKILHKKLKGTRGVVGLVIHLNSMTKMVTYAGLGNMSARIIGMDKNKSCISYNGIIGYTMPNTMHSNQVNFERNETLIIYSDGLKSRWEFNQLPDILNHDGSILAASLYKDFTRNTDDLLVIVVKLR